MTNTSSSIVAGVYVSTGSHSALLVADALATDLRDRLVLAHAVDDPLPFPYGDARMRELDRGRAVRAGARVLERIGRGLDAEARVVLGDASERLADVAGAGRLRLRQASMRPRRMA